MSEEEKLWERILQENTQKNKIAESHLVLLGCKNSGKRALLQALQSGPGSRSSSVTSLLSTAEISSGPLKYSHIAVKNPEDSFAENLTKLNTWLLTNPELIDLLSFAIKPEYLKNMIVGIVLDASRPDSLLEELNTWLGLWHDQIGPILSQMQLDDQDTLVNKVMKYHQLYNSEVEVPLAEDTLQVNMGIPIMVFVNKSDLVMSLDKSRDQSGKIIDFMQQNLRRECLRYGATLLFVSPKYNININLAYEYFMHRLYEFKLKSEAQVHEKNQIFIPSGWDSSGLISELDYVDISDPYEEVFKQERNSMRREEELNVEDDQTFLSQAKKEKFNNRTAGPAAQISKPNPGGDIGVNDIQHDGPGGNKSALQEFYSKLLAKDTGNKK